MYRALTHYWRVNLAVLLGGVKSQNNALRIADLSRVEKREPPPRGEIVVRGVLVSLRLIQIGEVHWRQQRPR